MGMLVEALIDRGIEAWGVDISEYGISCVRRDIAPYCSQASLEDPLPDKYDLITCIEVLEHMTPEGCARAIDNLTSAAPAILFSSSPLDLTESTHHNVQPVWLWLKQFAARGFYPDVSYNASYIAPQAMLLQKSDALPDNILLLFADGLMSKCHTSLAEERSSDLQARIDELEGRLREFDLFSSNSTLLVDENAALRAQLERHLSQRDVLIEDRQVLSKTNLRLTESLLSLTEHYYGSISDMS
jgi:Methyltransferase domain